MVQKHLGRTRGIESTVWDETFREIFRPEWKNLHPLAALHSLPAIAIALICGHIGGHQEWGIMAASGAVSVGFGSFQQWRDSRTAPMLLASLGMCVASWAGTLAGQSSVATVLLTAFAGWVYIAIGALGASYSWIALQAVIWLIISTAYPATGPHALTRGAFVLVGGMLQLGIIRSFWWIEHRHTPAMEGARITGACESQDIREVFDPRSCHFLLAVRAALTLGVAAAVYRQLTISNGYWIPMTAVLVLRADMRQSFTRGLARMMGTMLGTALATVAIVYLRPGHAQLTGMVVLFAGCSYALLWVNYAFFTVTLTAYVVALLSFAGLPAPFVIHHRLLNTIAGGILAVTIHIAFFGWERSRLVRERLHPNVRKIFSTLRE